MVGHEDRESARFGDYSPYAKDNFEFDRKIKLERRTWYRK